MKTIKLIVCFVLLASPAFSANYYVGTGGNDSNTGLSHAQRWLTITKVNATSFQTGDDVYFLCGSTFTGARLLVNWAGSVSNRAVIGAYYLDGGVETVGVNVDGKPVFDGNGFVFSNEFDGLATVNEGLSYVTIQDLELYRSAQSGIRYRQQATYAIVQRCTIHDYYKTGVIFSWGCNDSIVRYNKIYNGGRTRVEEYLNEQAGWPVSGIQATSSVRVQSLNNILYDLYSEGIALGNNAICKYNVVGDTMSVGIYTNGGNGIQVAYNLIYGTDSTTFNLIPSGGNYSHQTDWKGNGIAVGIEAGNYPNVYDVLVHHNTIINRKSGIRMYNSHPTSTLTDVYIYNNLLIDNHYNVWPSDNNGSINTNVRLINNISAPGHADSAHVYSSTPGITNWTVANNTWAHKTAPGGQFAGSGDTATDPVFTRAVFKGTIDSIADLETADVVPTVFVSGKNLGSGGYSGFIDGNSSTLVTDHPESIVVYIVNAANYGWVNGPFVRTAALPTNYYIDGTNGNDSNTGLSHAQAWKTLNKARQIISGGPSGVYLMCGTTYLNQYLNVSWGGSDSPVTIGAYYMDGGIETIGVNGEGKPIIQGVLDITDSSNNYPAVDSYLALVLITSPYVTVQDLSLKNSGQYGIRASAAGDYYSIKNISIDNTYWGNIFINAGGDNGLVERCKLTRSSMKMTHSPERRPWAGQIAFRHTNNTIVRHNYLQGSYGEGIGTGNGAKVYGNIVLDFYSVGIYSDGSSNVQAYHNVIGQTTAYSFSGRGLEVNIEPKADNTRNTTNIRFHHNTVFNCAGGFKAVLTNPTYYWDYIYLYNNQFIDCLSSFNINNTQYAITNRSVYVKNNISYPKHADTDHVDSYGTAVSSSWDFANNTWAVKSAPTGVYADASDSTTNPAYTLVDWRGQIATVADFATANMVATAVEAGADVGLAYNGFLDGNNSELSTDDPAAIITAVVDIADYGWVNGPFVSMELAGGPAQPPLADGSGSYDAGMAVDGASRVDADSCLDCSYSTQGDGCSCAQAGGVEGCGWLIAGVLLALRRAGKRWTRHARQRSRLLTPCSRTARIGG